VGVWIAAVHDDQLVPDPVRRSKWILGALVEAAAARSAATGGMIRIRSARAPVGQSRGHELVEGDDEGRRRRIARFTLSNERAITLRGTACRAR
jgi:hypothetical protein